MSSAPPLDPASFVGRWRAALARPGFRWRLVPTLIAIVASLAVFARFVQLVEARPGAVLDDPLLALFRPRDLSALTFALIYGGLAVALIDLARRPDFLLRALMAYVFLVLARMAMMWVTPLDPPVGMIPLRDPLIEAVESGHTLTRDLFFSGHTSLLFLLALCVPSRWLRRALLLATVAVAGLVLAQHTHYTVDVLVAPCVAFCAARLAAFACERESGWIARL